MGGGTMEAPLDSKDWIFPVSNSASSTGLLNAYYVPSTVLGLRRGAPSEEEYLVLYLLGRSVNTRRDSWRAVIC